MLLTIEYKNEGKDVSQGEIEIYCDQKGLDNLIEKLQSLKLNGGHEHFMTPSWAGTELTEEKQGENTTLLHHLCVMLRPK